MAAVCPSCEAPPPVDAIAGTSCAQCGATLVVVVEPEELIGQVVDGRFEIVALLGKGGMGSVFRARQRSIGRDVALKLIDQRFERDVTAVKRFMREAKLASQLVHPSSVPVIDFGQEPSGRLYLAMELVAGQTLQVALKQHAFSTERVVQIAAQLADVLDAAHALGIVHRDLKLENVMLGERDRVKVLDFGLARSLHDDVRATATGLIAGTPRYLAPEVALEAAAPAPPQDIYALGVIIAELATGEPLWDKPTIDGILTAKLTEPPELSAMDPALRELALRLIAIDPAARPTARVARDALIAIGARARREASEPTQQLLMPVDASQPAITPPSAAFAPPVPLVNPADLELEPEWRAGKVAKVDHAATAATPAKRSLAGVWIALAAVALVVGGWLALRDRRPDAVVLDIEAYAPASITIDGRAIGRTPLAQRVSRSNHALVIEATIDGHHYTKAISPTADQRIVFARP